MKFAKVCNVKYALPKYIETNEDIVSAMNLSWSAEDIYAKTGIKQRHIVTDDECASDLGVEAARRIFDDGSNVKENVDFLIFCSQSPDYALPSTASILQSRLGLSKSCGTIDINQGCSGYIYGLSIAKGLIEGGMANNVLLINAETYSKYIDKGDKSTRTIFGDGAAATLISASEMDSECLNNFVFGTDGAGKENLIVHNSATRKEAAVDNYLFMDGPEIFQFTLTVVPKTVKEVLGKAKININDIDYFIFHQANAFILEHLRKKLGVPKEKFFLNMEDIGNTVSASIPIALCRAMEAGCIKPGMTVMFLGFGVGYSWGGCILNF